MVSVMSNKQPDALRLATASDAIADEQEMIHLLSWVEIRNVLRADAAELRRLHALNAQMLEALQAALNALASISGEMTVGDRYTNAGQYLLDSLTPVRAAIAAATEAQQ